MRQNLLGTVFEPVIIPTWLVSLAQTDTIKGTKVAPRLYVMSRIFRNLLKRNVLKCNTENGRRLLKCNINCGFFLLSNYRVHHRERMMLGEDNSGEDPEQ